MTDEFYKIIKVIHKKVQIKKTDEELNIEIEPESDNEI